MWLAILKVVAVLAALFVYGAGVEPRFVAVDRISAPVPDLPAAWEGKQVAVFADLQVGMWWANKDAGRRAVRDAVAIHPAAVLIAGDFVYDADSSVDSQMVQVLAILQPLLDAHIPMYAVLGNHDYSLFNEHSDKESYVAHHVRVALDSAGVHMMDNTAVALPCPAPADAPVCSDERDSTRRLYLVGIGERWAMNDHPARALALVPDSAPRIVFMHDPDSFPFIGDSEAPFAIAAHTHGMQLGIPWATDWFYSMYISDEMSPAAGWATGYGNPDNHLYINRGIGFSILPLRIGAVPELTVVTLKRAK